MTKLVLMAATLAISIFANAQSAYHLNLIDHEEHKDAGHKHGKHFSLIEIQTGNSELGYTELLLPEGFDENTEVVIKGAYAILSKLKNSEDEGHHH